MSKLTETANGLVSEIQAFAATAAREEQRLADEKSRLSGVEESLKSREAAIAGVEKGEAARKAAEARKQELLDLQREISAGHEDLERQKKAFTEEKEKWEKQKAADQQGIDNERQEIRNQNAALAKEKAEYKEKLLKKLKSGVE